MVDKLTPIIEVGVAALEKSATLSAKSRALKEQRVAEANGVAAGGDQPKLSKSEKRKVENEAKKIEEQETKAARLADKRAGKAKITDEEVDANANDNSTENKLSNENTKSATELKPAKLTRRNSDPELYKQDNKSLTKSFKEVWLDTQRLQLQSAELEVKTNAVIGEEIIKGVEFAKEHREDIKDLAINLGALILTKGKGGNKGTVAKC